MVQNSVHMFGTFILKRALHCGKWFHYGKPVLLVSGKTGFTKPVNQLQKVREFWWISRIRRDTSILTSVRTDWFGLHHAHPQWETTRSSRLRKTQETLQETKRIVSEKMESMENIWTVPNGLCLLRIGLTPFLGYLVYTEAYSVALGVMVFAGLTDFLDGFIARTFPSQQSVLGSILDPAADKFLVATLFLSLTMGGLIPIPLTSLIISRDVCLMGAAFYLRYMTLPPPKTLPRYFDVTLPTASVTASLSSKINTTVQLSLVAFTLAAPVFNYVDHPLLHALWYVTAGTTIVSGISYALSKGSYKIVTKSNPK